MPGTQFETRSVRFDAVEAGTFDPKSRTVRAVLATETPVRRRDQNGQPYDEVLTVTPESINTIRLGHLPVLDSHAAVGLEHRIGTAVAGSLEIDRGVATILVRLSRNALGEAVYRDLQDGHTLSVSVGYRIEETEISEGESGIPVVRATRWEPLELSFVTVAADPFAVAREEPRMTGTETRSNSPAAASETPSREAEILELARLVGAADAQITRDAIARGLSVAEFRNALLNHVVERQERTPTFPHVAVGTGGNATFRDAVTDALKARVQPGHEPKPDAREFVGLSIGELARRCLERAGVGTAGLSTGAVIGRALHTAGDFPAAISGLGQSILADAYRSAPSGLKAVARRSTARDFRAKQVVRVSGFSDLEQVDEHAEFRRGTFSDGAESYRVSTFGKIFGISRQALINDDLGAFADYTRELGQAAARLEAQVLADLVNNAPAMSDGKAVFHADHKNLSASAALDENGLHAARLAMARQTGLAGELIDVTPRFLVVPPELQTVAEKLLAQISPTTSEEVNPFAGRLSLVVDRRLDCNSWYLVADPAITPSLEFSYLEGQEGPQFETRWGFDVDGVETRVRLDFGAGWVDYRGWHKVPVAAGGE